MLEGGSPELEGRAATIFAEKLAKIRAAQPTEEAEEPDLVMP
jgi:hypothetical protein